MSEKEKQVIEKELKMQFNYEELIQDDPVIQNLLAEREFKGKTEGEAESEVRGGSKLQKRIS